MSKSRLQDDRASRRARRRFGPELRALVARLATLGEGDVKAVRKLLGADRYDALTERQRLRICRQHELIGAWWEYQGVAQVGRGNVERARERFVDAVRRWWGERLTARSFQRWERKYEDFGLAALIDNRGRHRATAPLDAVVWHELCRLIGRGFSVQAAYLRVTPRAVREHRKWAALRTTQQRVRDGRVRLYIKAA